MWNDESPASPGISRLNSSFKIGAAFEDSVQGPGPQLADIVKLAYLLRDARPAHLETHLSGKLRVNI